MTEGTIITDEGATKGDPTDIRVEVEGIVSAIFPGQESRLFVIVGDEPHPDGGYALYLTLADAVTARDASRSFTEIESEEEP